MLFIDSSLESFWLRLIFYIFLFFLSSIGPVSNRKTEYHEPSAKSLQRAFLTNWLAFVTVATLWVFHAIILIIFRLVSIDGKSKLRQVYDDCSPATSQFKYLIRLRIGVSSPIFQKDTSAIMMDLLDMKSRFITRLSISPTWLKNDVYAKQTDKPRLRTLKFILNRAVTMPLIGGIRVSHDSYFPVGGYIFLHSIDFRNLQNDIFTQIPIFKRILVLPPDAKEFDQVFYARMTSKTSGKLIDGVLMTGHAPFLTFPEYLIFYFFYSNMSLLASMFMPVYLKIPDVNSALFNGLVGFGSSFFLTSLLLFFYRYTIKIFCSRARAIGPWAIIRTIFLICVTFNAMIIGFAASLIQSRYSSHYLTYWSLAVVIANICLVILILPTIAIVLLCKRGLARGTIESKLAISLTSKMVDEPVVDEQPRYDATRDRKGKDNPVNPNKDKVDKEDSARKVDADITSVKLETLIKQKISMEEGLSESPGNPRRSAREMIKHHIKSVLGRSSKEPASTGEEQIYAISKHAENKSKASASVAK